MKFLHKYGTRRNEIHRARKELYFRVAIVGAVLLFLALMMLVTQFRPRLSEEKSKALPQAANMGDPLSNPQLVRMRKEVDVLLEEFKLASAGSNIDSSNLDLLQQAIDKQRAIIRLGGSDIASKTDLDKMASLETILDEQVGAFLISESKRLELDAESKWKANEFDSALQLLVQARDLQEKVNSQHPKSPDRSPSRLHLLNNKIMTWQTGPLVEKADQLKIEALQAFDDGNIDLAMSKIREALETQRLLSTEFRASRFASIARMREFENIHNKIETAENTKTVQSLITQARENLLMGNPELALSKISQAEALHAEVLQRYPEAMQQHSMVSDQLEILKDTCSSHSAFNEIVTLKEVTRQALQQQDMETFQSSIADWYRASRFFKRSYPKSEYLGKYNEEEVNYLYQLRESIPSIMDMIYGNLVQVPNHQLLLYRTEVPQVLYSKVTGTNPSISVAPTNPVESLTWEEAIAFTQKTSWILARPVALPGREIFRSAIGTMDPAEIASRSWSSETSNRQIREVGSSEPNDLGFTDLLGNVSEWLDNPEDASSKVVAIGGAARDSRLRLATIPVESREPFERNRFIGFRFTVIMSD